MTYVGLLAALTGVTAGGQVAQPVRPDRSWLRSVRDAKRGTGEPVENLPYASGRSFATLEAYLTYLRDHAAQMDRPWYREVRPDVFRRESNLRPELTPQEFSRDDLERRFGFKR